MRKVATVLLGLLAGLVAQNVGIGTPSPTERFHVAGGDMRVEGLSGTGTALVGLDNQGVTHRIDFSGNAGDFLRGDGTWGPDVGDWNLVGNAGTNPTQNFLGTTDAQELRIRTNNAERIRMQVDGRILINTTTPLSNTAVLQVQGGSTDRAIYGWKNSSSGTAVVLGRATQGGSTRAGIVGRGVKSTGINPGTGLVGMVGVTDFLHWDLGPGIVGTGADHGIAAYAENTSGDRAAGRFEAPTTGGNRVRSLVSAFVGGTHYKIWGRVVDGSGNVVSMPSSSTVISDPAGRLYAMACPESPEILFMDRGEATLQPGGTYISFDPALAFNLYVDEQYPLYVFVQPIEADCKLYVTERSRKGFRVLSAEPHCQTRFYWWAVARRNDLYSPDGLRISRHVGVRLPVVPKDLP